jgi:molecular chaperone GrpE
MEPSLSENIQDEPEKMEPAETLDISALKKALEEEKAKAEANLAGWKRAQADFINYKRRSEQEKEELAKFANADLVCTILPVLDDMERAFATMPADLAEDPWVNGIKLIERKLKTYLEGQGVCRIEALGEVFDPRLHEAVRQITGKEGVVVEEVQKGYKLRDRVIRPSKVVVGMGEDKTKQDIDKGEHKEEKINE